MEKIEEWQFSELPTRGAPLLHIYAQKRPIANIARWEYPEQDIKEHELQKLITSTPRLYNCLIEFVELGRNKNLSDLEILEELDRIVTKAEKLLEEHKHVST